MAHRQSSTKRGYNERWKKARATYLKHHPLCAMCAQQGRTTIAVLVDHIKPHKGDSGLFWDKTNWQSLCKHCHDSIKQRIEIHGGDYGCGLDGVPHDKRHHWNK
jgi:5-methylcytosine-specific restriction enzyme A